jgi:hypothetical protein
MEACIGDVAQLEVVVVKIEAKGQIRLKDIFLDPSKKKGRKIQLPAPSLPSIF